MRRVRQGCFIRCAYRAAGRAANMRWFGGGLSNTRQTLAREKCMQRRRVAGIEAGVLSGKWGIRGSLGAGYIALC